MVLVPTGISPTSIIVRRRSAAGSRTRSTLKVRIRPERTSASSEIMVRKVGYQTTITSIVMVVALSISRVEAPITSLAVSPVMLRTFTFDHACFSRGRIPIDRIKTVFELVAWSELPFPDDCPDDSDQCDSTGDGGENDDCRRCDVGSCIGGGAADVNVCW